jgi:Gram-negative bacterial TonB protein C-terminal
MKRVPQLSILAFFVLALSALAQTPQPARRSGKAPKMIKVSSEVLEKKAVKRVKPVRPDGAPASGVVSIRVWVDVIDGKVVEAEIVSGPPLLRESALKAARQWEWEGLCGTPLTAVGVLNFDFSKK